MRTLIAVSIFLFGLGQAQADDLDELWKLPPLQGATTLESESGVYSFALAPMETSQEALEARYFGEQRDADFNVFLGKESALGIRHVRDANLFLGEQVSEVQRNEFRNSFLSEADAYLPAASGTSYFMMEAPPDAPINMFMP